MPPDIEIPDDYDVTLHGGLRITPDPITINPITINPMTVNSKATVDHTLAGDNSRPVSVELMNLPRLSLDDMKDLLTPKLRIHVPNYEQFSFKILGVELFSVCMSGEAQIISQAYKPNPYERCEEICESDTRPFPKTPTHTPAAVQLSKGEQ